MAWDWSSARQHPDVAEERLGETAGRGRALVAPFSRSPAGRLPPAPPLTEAGGDMAERLRQALRERSDLRLALLFGSWARNAAGPDSDVDLAVIGTGVDPLELGADLRRLLGREVQVLRLDRSLGVPMLEELIRDAIVVFEGAPGAAASWRAHVLLSLETDRPWYARMRDSWLRRVAERGL